MTPETLSPGVRPEIVLVGPLPPPYGGVSTFLERLTLAVPSIIYSVLDTGGDTVDMKRQRELPVPTHRLPDGTVRLWLTLWSRLRELPPDVLIVLNVSHPQGLLRYLPVVMVGLKTAVVLHHGTPRRRSGMMGSVIDWLTGHMLRSAVDLVVCLNETQARFVRRTYDVAPPSIRFASSYVPVDMFLPDSSPSDGSEGAIRVIASGEPKEYHHFEELIEMWSAEGFGETAELTICLYGPVNRPLESALDAAARNSHGVTLRRDLDGWAFLSILQGSDIYVRASSVDAFGIAVADAIRLGLEVIATDVCDRYPGCRLVPAEDWDALRDALRAAIASRSRADDRRTRTPPGLPGAHTISLLDSLDIEYEELGASRDEKGP